MKVILVFPPQFDPTIPNAALPCLTAVLRAAGHEVVQKDLNVESYNCFLTRSQLEKAFAKIQAEYNSLLFFGSDPGEIDRLLAQKDFLLNEVEPAKNVLRHPRDFYDYPRFTAAKQVIDDCLKVIGLPYPGTRLSFTSYQAYYSPDSTAEVLKAVQDPSFNLYYDFYLEHVIPGFLKEAPGVIGISISSRSQVLPGLTLAYLTKQALKNVHIVIGGIYFTILKENLSQNHHLFNLFDSVILHEGETALTQLVNCLENKKPLTGTPNLVYRDGAQIRVNGLFYEDLDALPTPSFEGLPFDQYFSPQLVLMIYASRGCYWGRCAFCNHCAYTGNKYRVRSPRKIIRDIKELKEKHGISIFGFSDLAVAPGLLDRLAEAIRSAALQINWFCMARFETKLDQTLSGKLAQSGCKILLFGLESGSDRVLTAMDKGINTATIRNVLTSTSNAGIANFITCFFGFPTETRTEAQETISLIESNLQQIASLTMSAFKLEEGSKIQQNPSHYKITGLPKPENRELSWIYDYQTPEGLSPQEAQWIAELFHRICAPTYPEFFELDLPYLLFILHYQRNNPGQRPMIQPVFDPGQWQTGIEKVKKEIQALSSSPQKGLRSKESPDTSGG